jgi:hypothetical protein
MTAKGVKKYVIKNKLTHDNFKGVIKKKEQMRHNMNTMRSVKHNVGTYEMRKVTLSCFDDKRHLLNDGVTSYAYGNKNIRKSPKDEIVEVKEGKAQEVYKLEEIQKSQSFEIHNNPEVKVTIEEEIVKMKMPRIEYIQPEDAFLLKVIIVRKKERELSYSKQMMWLVGFGWDQDKIAQYMMENDKPMLCEYTPEELAEYKKKRKVPGESYEEMEDVIGVKIERGRKKLIRRYEGYLGIREDTGDPVEEDKEWLHDHGKAEGEPDDIVDENLEEVHCDACEDENQPNSSVDEVHETQNNFTPNRT